MIRAALVGTVAALSLMAGSLAARAADAIVEAPSAFNWTGAYIGGQIGYLWGDSTSTFEDDEFALDADPDGFIGGIYGGVNYQLPNNVVLGLDLDYAWSNADGNGDLFDNGIPLPDSSAEVNLEESGAVRGRLGYAFDRFIPYVAGGVAFGKVEYALYEEGELFKRDHDTYTGYTLGAGVEYAFTDNLIGRLEYRFTDFGDQTFDTEGFSDLDIDLKSHDIRVGIAYKF